ncbi:ROK family protein [Clostridium sp. YIM B02551]|uniref:ROK family protein n=1 Tax=Clostridium sp. YIM B02551 TaxID=2910679 RepID=UPI001EEC6A2F|nr:ROK family protein [Clostridium sp. YIM B02551]
MLQVSNNTIKVKQINIQLIKNALKASSYGTKTTIAKATGLSIATCGNILNELLEKGEVLEIDLEESNGGRPARRFIYNADYAYIACMYLRTEGKENSISYVITNLLGENIEEGKIIVKSINFELIDTTIEELIMRYENIMALGIGVPGVVHDGHIGVCDISDLVNFPLGEKLKEKYQVEVIIENDMNFTAFGFYEKQEYDEDKTLVYALFPKDNLPGAGIIIDGHMFKGNTKFAGELSFLPFDMKREEQLIKLNNNRDFLKIVVKSITSIIAIINPETIVLSGDLFKGNELDEIYKECTKIIPKEHMANIFIKEDIHEDYMNGIVSITLESLNYNIKLIERKI